MAILLAGPVFVAVLPFAIWQAQPDVAVQLPGDWRFAIALVPLFVMVTIFGALIAFMPVLLGSTLMEALGRVNFGCRLPVVWALAGAALAGLPTLAFKEPTSWATLALSVTGAICALVCRRGVDWDVDAPLSEARSPAICIRHGT